MQDEQHVRYDMVEALRQSRFLRLVGQTEKGAELQKLLKAAEVVKYRRGTQIIREGSRSDRMFFLISGRVEVSKEGIPIGTLEEMGDVFGEMGAITGEKRSATCTAMSEVTCLATQAAYAARLSEEENILFLQLLQQALGQVLTERLGQVNSELKTLREDSQALHRRVERLERENRRLEEENAEFRAQGRDRLHVRHQR